MHALREGGGGLLRLGYYTRRRVNILRRCACGRLLAGHVFITSQNVQQNVTDLLGQSAASKLFAAQAEGIAKVGQTVTALDESISPRLQSVERKSVKRWVYARHTRVPP